MTIYPQTEESYTCTGTFFSRLVIIETLKGKRMKQLNRRPAVKGFFMVVMSALVLSCGKPNDKEIQENVSKKLQESYKGINAEVSEGVVTLTGSCEGENCSAQAQQQIAEMDGVKSVKNNIQADTGTDLTLRTSVQTIISKYQGVQADVAAGNVVLRGSINRDQVQPLMNELEALQPKRIDNQLAVK
jgi:osmotically-inducible protein OsmY